MKNHLSHNKPFFYPFYDEPALTDYYLSGKNEIAAIICPEPIFCQWLHKHASRLDLTQAQKIAVLCAQKGFASAIALLCPSKVSPDYGAPSLLEIAIRSKHKLTAEALLYAGADINLQRGAYQQTLLMTAVMRDATEEVTELINTGANVNVVDIEGWSALTHAVFGGNAILTEILINAGAKHNIKDKLGWTAIMYASYDHHDTIVTLLRDAGAATGVPEQLLPAIEPHLKQQNKLQHLVTALEQGHFQYAIELIALGHFNVNCLVDGQSALDLAIEHHAPSFLAKLLTHESLCSWAVLHAVKQCIGDKRLRETLFPLFLESRKIRQLISISRHAFCLADWQWALQRIRALNTTPTLLFTPIDGVRSRAIKKSHRPCC